MSDLKNLILSSEKPQQCDECGKIAELRPYGKDGACICFACGEKIPEVVEENMKRILNGGVLGTL